MLEQLYHKIRRTRPYFMFPDIPGVVSIEWFGSDWEWLEKHLHHKYGWL